MYIKSIPANAIMEKEIGEWCSFTGKQNQASTWSTIDGDVYDPPVWL